jgi:hypothetical protein
MIVQAHVLAAILALLTGIGALVFPNGTKTHKRLGIGYLAAWALVGGTGIFFVARPPHVRAFGVCLGLGVICTAIAWTFVLFRKRIGKSWLRGHYLFMLCSLAALLGPSTNQLLWNLGLEYPKWVFYALVVAPWAVVPFGKRWLDARFAPTTTSAGRAATT